MVGYLSDSIDLLRSLSRFPLPVSSVFTGASTQPRTAARLSPPVISPVTVVVAAGEVADGRVAVEAQCARGEPHRGDRAVQSGRARPAAARSSQAAQSRIRRSEASIVTPPWSVRLSSVQPVLANLVQQRRARDAEQLRGAAAVAPGVPQRERDVPPLGRIERSGLRRAQPAPAPRAAAPAPAPASRGRAPGRRIPATPIASAAAGPSGAAPARCPAPRSARSSASRRSGACARTSRCSGGMRRR